jgi:hypothetical protein
VGKLLNGTLSKKVIWRATSARAGRGAMELTTTVGNVDVFLWKVSEDRESYTYWLAIEPRAQPPGRGASRRDDAFSDDNLREAGFSTAAASLIELYSLADRQAFAKDQLVDELAEALADIPAPSEDDKAAATLKTYVPDPADDDIPF